MDATRRLFGTGWDASMKSKNSRRIRTSGGQGPEAGQPGLGLVPSESSNFGRPKPGRNIERDRDQLSARHGSKPRKGRKSGEALTGS